MPYTQDWSNIAQITADDNWAGVPGWVGYRGDDLTVLTGTDPRTITADGTATPVDVNANIASVTFATGGVTEFQITNPVVGLQGSGTADAPFILLNLDLTGRTSVMVTYDLRDLDTSADDAAQQFALQYRVGSSGLWSNATGGYTSDATLANSGSQVTSVVATLPAAVDGQTLVQLRWMTTNAAGNDEGVGVDNIVVKPQFQAAGAATPSSVFATQTSKLTVTVTPATTPASTGITVLADLSAIGGLGVQPFFDDGTNGDVTAGDNIFSFDATVTAGTTGGLKTMSATAFDLETRTAATSIALTVNVAVCGNATVEPGEECDGGACCSALSCAFIGVGTECRASGGVCDPAEQCSGSAAACPADFKDSTHTCRPVGGDCDVAEVCDGVNDACPADGFKDNSNVCRGSGGACDIEDKCTGSAAACPADAKSTAECRGSDGACDLAESCDGVNNACPADAHSTAECRPSGGDCDPAESCDGVADGCPADAKSTSVCRVVAPGGCDVAESCDGVANTCPADVFLDNSNTCRGSGGACDPAEACTGSSAACPADAKSTAECRASGGDCDPAEACDGVNNGCPADAKSTAECRGSAGDCDLAESCDGVANSCPADAKSTAVCRAAGNVCDAVENCDGTTDDCPTDVDLPDTTTCDDSNTCTTGTSCTAGVCSGGSAEVSAAPLALDFTDTLPGDSVDLTVTLSNNSTGPADITALDITNDLGFSADAGTLPVTIAAGASADVTVTFHPIAPITYSGTLSIEVDLCGSFDVQLEGTGIDTTPTDAGVPDAGTVDAAVGLDAAPAPDASGPGPDAGTGGGGDGGCCSTSSAPGDIAGHAFLLVLGAALALRRRRRR